MASTRRSRRVAATPQMLWELIEDPHHMPRWWPGVKRMEAVEDDRWTQVFHTKKGKPVRLDFHLLASEPPGTQAGCLGRRMWEQEIPGTPFERVLDESVTEILLEPDEHGTRITIEQRQKLRGYSRTGGFMMRRAASIKLDQALEGLERCAG